VLRTEYDDAADEATAAVERRAAALRERVNRLLPEADEVFETFEAVDRAGR
jgi:hypothetical protein